MTSWLQQFEQVALTGFEDVVNGTSIGEEEKAAGQAIVAAIKTPSVTTVGLALTTALQSITDLKAQIATLKAEASTKTTTEATTA